MKQLDPDELVFEEGEEEVILASEGEQLGEDETKVIIPKCEFLTGGAGTGKTYEIKRRMEEHRANKGYGRQYGVLAATTGIAAINLGDGTTTINSVLGYFDSKSLEENYASGKLHRALKEVAKRAEFLIIDEISMMAALPLDIIWNALVEINQQVEVKEMGGLGIIITGDFCQLPPVGEKDNEGKEIPAKYAFEAQCWKYFDANTTKLTKVWRQSDPKFVDALSYARRGDGEKAAQILKGHEGVRFCEEVDTEFDGTTIFSKNAEVDRLNNIRLIKLLNEGREEIVVKSWRWGKQRGEWKLIPEELKLCKDSYVMILANDSKMNGFRYANGSTGYVEGFDLLEGFGIRLKGKFKPTETIIGMDVEDIRVEPQIVEIGKICRQIKQKDHPQGLEKPDYPSYSQWKQEHDSEFTSAKQAKYQYEMFLQKLTKDNRSMNVIEKKEIVEEDGEKVEKVISVSVPKGEIYFDYEEAKWVIGEIHYYPIRLAYASTVHKSQGLTLDTVQIDFANKFFGSASMGYVALSRCKTAEGLRLVGGSRLLESRINISRKVLKWI